MDTEVFTVAIVFFSMVAIIKIITDYATRKRLIDKGLVDEKVKYLFAGYGQTQVLNNIKWGMVLVAIGMALLWKQFAPYWVSNESVLGLMFILGGIGFLVYYFIAKKHMEKHTNNTSVG